jgi:formylglycine-generating enzyme required for sulfatase activity
VHAAIGSYAPNPFGLHDVYGNVWEWCEDEVDADRYALTLQTSQSDIRVRGRARVHRGGGFLSPAVQARSAYSDFSPPEFEHDTYGLRPMRVLEGTWSTRRPGGR